MSTTTTAGAEARTEMGCDRNGSGSDKAQQARDRIDQRIEALAKAVDAERASTEYRAYLDTQARFNDYS